MRRFIFFKSGTP